MRIPDPLGRWKPHEDYPELLVRVPTGEVGSYRLLGTEGFDDDDDGRINEDGPGYYDPNRDWPWQWQPDYVQRGAHRYPLSVPENRMVADFVLAHPNIMGSQSYHNAGGMILRGPGAKSDKFEQADIALLDVIGRHGEELLPGYKYMNVANDLYEVYGGELDWFYAMRGAYALTNELFTPFNFFRRPSSGGFFGKDEDVHSFAKSLLLEDGMVPWHEVEHPDYGKVEVGGLKKNWLRQPPSFLLEEECHRNMAFSLYHADQLPQVKVETIETRDLGDGLTEVTARIANRKLLPTRAQIDLTHKLTPPDVAEITGAEGLNVIVAMQSEHPLLLNPEIQERDPAKLKIDRIGSMSAVYARWIMEGAGPFTVKVTSIKGGRDSKTTE